MEYDFPYPKDAEPSHPYPIIFFPANGALFKISTSDCVRLLGGKII